MTPSDPRFVHQFVPGSEEEPTLLILLPGTGGNETNLLPSGRLFLPSATLLSPRGKVLENDKLR